MHFLIDNSMSPRFAVSMREAGHDAVHVRELGMAAAADEMIFDHAAVDQRVIVAQDTDFGTILAIRRSAGPSVILFRCMAKSTEATSRMLLAHLPSIQTDLDAGAVVVFEDARVRIRRLPIGGRPV